MKLLHDRILKDGVVREGNILKVDSFLNHQMDISLLNEIGKEFKNRFANENINKIFTIEASGIGIAAIVAQYFNNAPVVFAKKTESLNLDKDLYETKVYSYTKQKEYSIRVGKKFLNKDDNILIIDDFLAKGCASKGLIEIIKQSEANIIGVGIVIEKGFQEGRKILEKERIRVESLAIIDSLDDNIVKFR